MSVQIRRPVRLLAACAALLLPVSAGVAAAAADPPGSPVVAHSGMVTRQDIPSRLGSETDTVVEPDVAVSPLNPDIAVAAAHDSRYSNGGAVTITAAWTHDGGASWHHFPVQGITKATGGTWDRASDPVLAFGPDGSVYLSVLEISVDCPSAVVVLRSTDGGMSYGRPHYAHRSTRCEYSDDKNWIVVDRSPSSPYYGRLYQFWTPFRYTTAGDYRSSPQALRWSDDHGLTWSRTSYVSALNHSTQNSQPMIMADGTIVDTFYDFGAGGMAPDAVPGLAPDRQVGRASAAASPATIDATGTIYATTSTDGGSTWSNEIEVANNAYGYSPNVRCCLFAADIDPATGIMYTAFEGGVGNTDPVYVSWSRDGVFWSSPERVSQGDVNGVTRVNVDVVALHGTVYVSYGTRTDPQDHGGYVQQQLSVSTDRGRTFGVPSSIGPRSQLKYAARSRGYFPGDYIGEALTPGRLYVVFAVSSRPPPESTSRFHQVIWGVTLDV